MTSSSKEPWKCSSTIWLWNWTKVLKAKRSEPLDLVYIYTYILDGQAALKRGLSFVIIVDSLFLIPDSLRQSLSSLLLHHSARFPRPSARFVLPSARFLIPDSYLPPLDIAQGALRRALCYISCLPPPDSCSPPPASYLPPCASYLPLGTS